MSPDVADLVFVWLAHIENKYVVARIQPALELFNLHICRRVGHRFFLPANAAKLVVVYQLGHRGVCAAHRTVAVLAQLEHAELHVDGIDQQQTSDQRFAFAQDELDDFRGLHHSHQTRQDAKYTALGAGRNQARRWRFRIQAAIAWTLFGSKHAGLTFEAEDGSIHIRLAGQHASIINEVASGEVVGAVGDDVKITKEFQSVRAAKPRIKRPQIQKGIDRLELVSRRVELLAPHIGGGVNDLPLQVGVVDDIKVDQAQRPHARGRQIQSQR